MSKASYKSARQEVMESIREEDRPEWDKSTVGDKEKRTVEDRVAAKVADQVLDQNPVSCAN